MLNEYISLETLLQKNPESILLYRSEVFDTVKNFER